MFSLLKLAEALGLAPPGRQLRLAAQASNTSAQHDSLISFLSSTRTVSIV